MSAANRRFARHYIEMLVVMVVGVIALRAPLNMIVHANGAGVMLAKMGATMTVAMFGWMRVRAAADDHW